MTKKKMSKFDIWFKKQFGLHPDDMRHRDTILDEMDEAKIRLNSLEAEWEIYNCLSTEYRAALYAKEAAEKDFKV